MKIGMIAGVVLVIGTTLVFSLWPGSSVEDRLQRMQQQQRRTEPAGPAAPGAEAIRPLESPANPLPTDAAPPGGRRLETRSDEEILRQLREQAQRAVAGESIPPAVAPEEAAAAAPKPPRTIQVHTVESGETLSHISHKYYGTANKWDLILRANPDVIQDPDRVRPGMRLRIPAENE